MPLLEIQNLATYFHQKNETIKAVNGLDLTINSGETLALVGESGSGKTMTALSILQLVPYPGRIMNGRILFQNRDLTSLDDKEMQHIRGRHIGLIMQDPFSALNPVIRVGDQISEVIRHHFNASRKQAREQALEMMRIVQLAGVENKYKKYPHQLSGGERQRILMAIALACRPQLLIADEPTTALDVTIQSQILDLLRSLKEKFDLSLLLITHDLGIVAEMADRVAVMYAGRIVEQAVTHELFEKPLHPYTKTLLDAMPKVSFAATDKIYKFEIKTHGNALHSDAGCDFARRCPVAQPQCNSAVPLKIADNGRIFRCIQ